MRKVLISRQDRCLDSAGDGANKIIDGGSPDPLLPTLIEEAGSVSMIFGSRHNIREAFQELAEPIKLFGMLDPGKKLLADDVQH